MLRVFKVVLRVNRLPAVRSNADADADDDKKPARPRFCWPDGNQDEATPRVEAFQALL